MELSKTEIRTLAAMLCDYAQAEMCLAPDELDIVIKIAINANFPQDSIEALWRLHAESLANLEA